MNITTVRVLKPTIERLKKIGHKEETYDEIINRLIDNYENSKNTSV